VNKISSDQNPSTVLLSVISKCNSSDIDNIPQTSNWAFGANHDCGNPIYGRIQPLWRQAFTHMNSLRKFIPREPSVTTGVVITVTRQRDKDIWHCAGTLGYPGRLLWDSWVVLRSGAFVTGRKKRTILVLFNPHLTFDPEDYIGHTIRFWKDKLPNILKTYRMAYVVFRVKT
jgi:hypothetical protein